MILPCKVRSIIFMASQDVAILLFGTLQNSHKIQKTDIDEFWSRPILLTGRSLPEGSRLTGGAPRCQPLRQPAPSHEARLVQIQNATWTDTPRKWCPWRCKAPICDGQQANVPNFKKLVPCRAPGRQAIIYLVEVATAPARSRHSADACQ